jgi:ABC-type glycerol-3-phosphate transport system substrate-binding protein
MYQAVGGFGGAGGGGNAENGATPGQAGTVLDDSIRVAVQEVLLKKVSVEKAFKKAEAAVTASIKKELDN